MRRRKPWMMAGAVMLACMALATALDPWVERWINAHGHLRYNSDWLRMLRVAGFLPAWGAISVCLALTDLRARIAGWWDRGAMVMISVLATSGAAEVIKLIVRRERPERALEQGVVFAFRPFDDGPLSSSGIGFPSSHAAVAFGGAFMLIRVAPAIWPVVLVWAGGCALSRVLTGAHYLSDAVAAGLVGYACSALLWSIRSRNTRRAGAPLSA